MNIVSAEQMYEIDKRAQNEFLIPIVAIMEQAGYQVADAIRRELQGKPQAKIVIVAGHGNNAIDALIAARYLHNWDFAVKVFVLSKADGVSDNMQLYISMLEKSGVELSCMDFTFWNRLSISLRMGDLIVDGILGIGFTGELSEDFAKAIHIINQIPVKTVAVDIPSGCRADTGEIASEAVRADVTLSICLPKQGLFLAPASYCVGRLQVLDINIPKNLLEDISNTRLITAELVAEILPQRDAYQHKYQVGKTTVLAGNTGMVGAAFLATTACMRIGAGMVDTFTMQPAYHILATKLTESLVYPVSEEPAVQSLQKFVHSASTSKSVLLGPGMGNNIYTKEFVPYILKNISSKPVVIDADALGAAFANTDLVKNHQGEIAITPHAGEFSRLINVGAATIETNKVELARSFAKEMGISVVLKGPVTVIAFPDGEVYINNCAMSNMASAGMGDVLAGMIAGLSAQGLGMKEACIAGVYLHTYAAERLKDEGLNVGMTASELANALPQAVDSFKNIYKKQKGGAQG